MIDSKWDAESMYILSEAWFLYDFLFTAIVNKTYIFLCMNMKSIQCLSVLWNKNKYDKLTQDHNEIGGEMQL